MAGKGGSHHSGGHQSSGKAAGGEHHHNSSSSSSGGGKGHSSSKMTVQGGMAASKERVHAMPKWALDNRAKQLNPNSFRYRGPKTETKESS